MREASPLRCWICRRVVAATDWLAKWLAHWCWLIAKVVVFPRADCESENTNMLAVLVYDIGEFVYICIFQLFIISKKQ